MPPPGRKESSVIAFRRVIRKNASQMRKDDELHDVKSCTIMCWNNHAFVLSDMHPVLLKRLVSTMDGHIVGNESLQTPVAGGTGGKQLPFPINWLDTPKIQEIAELQLHTAKSLQAQPHAQSPTVGMLPGKRRGVAANGARTPNAKKRRKPPTSVDTDGSGSGNDGSGSDDEPDEGGEESEVELATSAASAAPTTLGAVSSPPNATLAGHLVPSTATTTTVVPYTANACIQPPPASAAASASALPPLTPLTPSGGATHSVRFRSRLYEIMGMVPAVHAPEKQV